MAKDRKVTVFFRKELADRGYVPWAVRYLVGEEFVTDYFMTEEEALDWEDTITSGYFENSLDA